MKVAVISDLHANHEALMALSNTIVQADAVVCLGDLLGYYCQVNETMDWVRKHVTHCVLGNHDYFVLHGCPENAPAAVRFGVEFAAKSLDRDHTSWLGQLPLTWEGRLDGRSILLFHGSPWNPLGGYLYEDNPRLAELAYLNFDVIAFGQTHRYFCRSMGNQVQLNPGAVGQSRDRNSLARACAAILDTRTMKVERIVRRFEVDEVLRVAYAQGAGPWIKKHLVA